MSRAGPEADRRPPPCLNSAWQVTDLRLPVWGWVESMVRVRCNLKRNIHATVKACNSEVALWRPQGLGAWEPGRLSLAPSSTWDWLWNPGGSPGAHSSVLSPVPSAHSQRPQPDRPPAATQEVSGGPQELPGGTLCSLSARFASGLWWVPSGAQEGQHLWAP